MPATPKKGRRFGGNAAHQRLMMANLAASLFAAEGIVTTEAKALRPVAEKLITKARRADADPDVKLHQIRQVVAYLGDREMTHKLFSEIGRGTPTATAATPASSSSAAPGRQRAAGTVHRLNPVPHGAPPPGVTLFDDTTETPAAPAGPLVPFG